jgi:ribosomal-protein-alanine N-acetyltransferase
MQEELHTQEEQLHIQTPRLHVRHLTLSDLADFHLYRSNPEVAKYQGSM